MEEDRKLDRVHELEAGMMPPSTQATPAPTPHLERRNSKARANGSTADQTKESEAQKLRDFTKGCFTNCKSYSRMIYLC